MYRRVKSYMSVVFLRSELSASPIHPHECHNKRIQMIPARLGMRITAPALLQVSSWEAWSLLDYRSTLPELIL
jgi:hypothetical protein